MLKKKHVAAVIGVLILFVLAHSYGIAMLGGAALATGYVIDVRLKPRSACGTCGGRGGHGGWLFGWGQSSCLDCGGAKTHVRWGARRFGGPAAKTEYRLQREAKRRGYRRLGGRWGNWQPAGFWSR